jgi:flavin-dependent dehydrogenase
LLNPIFRAGIAFTAATASNIRRAEGGWRAEGGGLADRDGLTDGGGLTDARRPTDAAWRVDTEAGPFFARTILDARGRRARRSDVRGPRLVAWNQLFRSAAARGSTRSNCPGASASAVVALSDGWCWLARTRDTLALQFVGSANRHLDPQELARRFEAAAAFAAGFVPLAGAAGLVESSWIARGAVARYSSPCRSVGFIRIGDAAVAMDPLSGNGVHEAVRSATAAVAAVNSFLQGVSWEVVAKFIDERAWELWRRSVAAAGRFYRLQAEHAGGAFWTSTASEYERLARDATVRHEGPARFEKRPVLDGHRIDLRRVWVSAEWPRGLWRVGGREIAQVPAELVPSILRRAARGLPREVSDDR